MNLVIFTDGASKGNPGPGGFGVVGVFGERVVELGGFDQNTTNNRMELRAVIEGLKLGQKLEAETLEVYSDSKYVLEGVTKWVHAWAKKGWVTSTGQDVLNQDLWQELLALTKLTEREINWHYVGGHIGIAGNERADVIASNFALNKKVELYTGPASGYELDVLNFKFDQAKQAEKKGSKSKSKQKAYSYVSSVDGVILVHKSWAQCEARVKGKKARFKKAVSQEDETNIIKEFST